MCFGIEALCKRPFAPAFHASGWRGKVERGFLPWPEQLFTDTVRRGTATARWNDREMSLNAVQTVNSAQNAVKHPEHAIERRRNHYILEYQHTETKQRRSPWADRLSMDIHELWGGAPTIASPSFGRFWESMGALGTLRLARCGSCSWTSPWHAARRSRRSPSRSSRPRRAFRPSGARSSAGFHSSDIAL